MYMWPLCIVVLELIIYPAHGGGERGYESREVLWRTSQPNALGIKPNVITVATDHNRKSILSFARNVRYYVDVENASGKHPRLTLREPQ